MLLPLGMHSPRTLGSRLSPIRRRRMTPRWGCWRSRSAGNAAGAKALQREWVQRGHMARLSAEPAMTTALPGLIERARCDVRTRFTAVMQWVYDGQALRAQSRSRVFYWHIVIGDRYSFGNLRTQNATLAGLTSSEACACHPLQGARVTISPLPSTDGKRSAPQRSTEGRVTVFRVDRRRVFSVDCGMIPLVQRLYLSRNSLGHCTDGGGGNRDPCAHFLARASHFRPSLSGRDRSADVGAPAATMPFVCVSNSM